MTQFLDNWENSRCWDAPLPEPPWGGEAVAANVQPPRFAASDERLAPKLEPLELDAGALLDLLDLSVRYVNNPEKAEQIVHALVGEAGHFGLDVETAKLAPHAHHNQAGLNPYLSRIRLLQLYVGSDEVYVFDLFTVPPAVLRPLLEKQFVAHNAIFALEHFMHAGLEPRRIDCTMLQSNALT